eukprot:tig00000145_g8826.t1
MSNGLGHGPMFRADVPGQLPAGAVVEEPGFAAGDEPAEPAASPGPFDRLWNAVSSPSFGRDAGLVLAGAAAGSLTLGAFMLIHSFFGGGKRKKRSPDEIMSEIRRLSYEVSDSIARQKVRHSKELDVAKAEIQKLYDEAGLLRAQLARYEDVIAAFRGNDAHLRALSASALEELFKKLQQAAQRVNAVNAQQRDASIASLAPVSAPPAGAAPAQSPAATPRTSAPPAAPAAPAAAPRTSGAAPALPRNSSGIDAWDCQGCGQGRSKVHRRELRPCGHHACSFCSEKVLKSGVCHVCRGPVEDCQPVFSSLDILNGPSSG